MGGRLALRLGRRSLTVLSDSEVEIAQVLRLLATSLLTHQQRMLHGLATVFFLTIQRKKGTTCSCTQGKKLARIELIVQMWIQL